MITMIPLKIIKSTNNIKEFLQRFLNYQGIQ